MLIIGERINSTRLAIQGAIKARNASIILKEAASQLAAGAHYIDINCAVTSGDEILDIDWVVSVIQSEIRDVNLCIDSPGYLAIERALKVYKGRGSIMINSITADEARIKNMLPLALKYSTKLIALTMDERKMPETASERFQIAERILERLRKEGFPAENLYFDPLIRPVSTEPAQAREVFKSIPMIKALGVKTVCGLSNISYGLPDRRLVNSTFLAMAVHAGLDAVILDPLDKEAMSILRASRALLNMDEYCANYIKAFREGRLR